MYQYFHEIQRRHCHRICDYTRSNQHHCYCWKYIGHRQCLRVRQTKNCDQFFYRYKIALSLSCSLNLAEKWFRAITRNLFTNYRIFLILIFSISGSGRSTRWDRSITLFSNIRGLIVLSIYFSNRVFIMDVI